MGCSLRVGGAVVGRITPQPVEVSDAGWECAVGYSELYDCYTIVSPSPQLEHPSVALSALGRCLPDSNRGNVPNASLIPLNYRKHCTRRVRQWHATCPDFKRCSRFGKYMKIFLKNPVTRFALIAFICVAPVPYGWRSRRLEELR